jgi:hypothetical protein
MKGVSPWVVPLSACLTIVLVYLWLSPDAFILALLLLPFLFGVAVVFAILFLRTKSLTRLSVAVGALTALLTIPSLLFFGRPLREQVFFQIWRLAHIEQATNPQLTNQVLEHWDSWGFASMDNDTFLASDRDDALMGAIPARHSPTLPEPRQPWRSAGNTHITFPATSFGSTAWRRAFMFSQLRMAACCREPLPDLNVRQTARIAPI